MIRLPARKQDYVKLKEYPGIILLAFMNSGWSCVFWLEWLKVLFYCIYRPELVMFFTMLMNLSLLCIHKNCL